MATDSASMKAQANTVSKILEQLIARSRCEVLGIGLPEGHAAHACEEALWTHIEAEARERSADAFLKLMGEVRSKLASLVTSSDAAERLAGVTAIDCLIGTRIEESLNKVSAFGSDISKALRGPPDYTVAAAASSVLAHLVREGGAYAADVVEAEVKQSLEWLSKERVDSPCRRYTAVLVLKELAENAPTIFNVYVNKFLNSIWSAVYDNKRLVREAAVSAVRACLEVIEQRETRHRVPWYYQLYAETRRGLGMHSNRGGSVESIHGTLLVIGELLRHTGEFMLARYREVAQTVLGFAQNQNKLIRRAAVSLIPKLAAFSPDRFAVSYLSSALEILCPLIRRCDERPTAFASLRDTANNLHDAHGAAERIRPRLPEVFRGIKECTGRKRTSENCLEAIGCAGALAMSMNGEWEPYIVDLLPHLCACAPTSALISSMHDISRALPHLISMLNDYMHNSLLSSLSLVPIGTKPAHALSDSADKDGCTNGQRQQQMNRRTVEQHLQKQPSHHQQPHPQQHTYGDPVRAKESAMLALKAVGKVQFDRGRTIKLVEDHVLRFVDTDIMDLRKEAVSACCRVTENIEAVNLKRRALHSLQRIVERLLHVAVSDVDSSIRKEILLAMKNNRQLDSTLCGANLLSSLFLSVNDESPVVRQTAISVTGRISGQNPALILPAMRRHLLTLLDAVEHGAESQLREEGALELSVLVHSCSALVTNYVPPILRLSIRRFQEESGIHAHLHPSGGERAALLKLVGSIAEVGREHILTFASQLMPILLANVYDGGPVGIRPAAVKAIGKLAEHSGYVITPLIDYPQLLGYLLNVLAEETTDESRVEVLRALGAIGALDPQRHKIHQERLLGEGKLSDEGVRAQKRINEPTVSGAIGGDRIGAAYGGGAVDPAVNAHHAALTGGGAGAGNPTTTATDAQTKRWQEADTMDLLPSASMRTSQEDFYPTVAINALLKVLNDSALSSQHETVLHSLQYIFKSMGMQCVSYLQSVMPVLLGVVRTGEESLKIFVLQQLTALVSVIKAHIRKHLDDLLALVHELWPKHTLVPALIDLLQELAKALDDDFRPYVPELVPRLVGTLASAERASDLQLIERVLCAFETFGSGIDTQLHLILPVLSRLYGQSMHHIPIRIRSRALRSLATLLPRMNSLQHTAGVAQPLLRVLDGNSDHLRHDAAEALTALAASADTNFRPLLPQVRAVLERHNFHHRRLEGVLRRCELGQQMDDGNIRTLYHDISVGDVSKGPSNAPDLGQQVLKFPINGEALCREWDPSHRFTKDDWVEWMRHVSVELLRHTPSPALRACLDIAQVQPQVARELFCASFASCWQELNQSERTQLIRFLELAFGSRTIPPEIVTSLLKLAEFMEHDERPLPVDASTLYTIAERCHAFAKALRYKEHLFWKNPEDNIEDLIGTLNQLHQPEAANGVLTYAQYSLNVAIKESWFEKLNRWDAAINSYDARLRIEPMDPEANLGKARCLAALADWQPLADLSASLWDVWSDSKGLRAELAPMATQAAWALEHWSDMATYVTALEKPSKPADRLRPAGAALEGVSSKDPDFYKALLHIHGRQYGEAARYVDLARRNLGVELTALVSESYGRAYNCMLRVQQLTELDEIIEFCRLRERNCSEDEPRMQLLRQMWSRRIAGVKQDVDIWQALLLPRSLVLSMDEERQTWIQFASLNRKAGRLEQARRTLVRLLGYDPKQRKQYEAGYGASSGAPDVMLAYLKHMWVTGEKSEAFHRLQFLVQELRHMRELGSEDIIDDPEDCWDAGGSDSGGDSDVALAASDDSASDAVVDRLGNGLIGKALLKLGQWRWELAGNSLNDTTIADVLAALKMSTEVCRKWSKAWHEWAIFNAAALEHYSKSDPDLASRHVAPAVSGFFRSIALASNGSNNKGDCLQDMLRLLTLWFNHGASPEVEAALHEGFGHVSIGTWLGVIPQIVARIHSSTQPVRNLIHHLLVRIGRQHPQALLYPLFVATKSQSRARQQAAEAVLENMRTHSATLVEQAQLVSEELIRVAILWHEAWHEALEEASRLYFGEHNPRGMLDVLLPLHEALEKQGPETMQEISFWQNYGRELSEAHEWCKKYIESGQEHELTQAWDLYYHVFRRLNKYLPQLTTLELSNVSPRLLNSRHLELAVPGNYIAGVPVVTISSFAPTMQVIASKQRPRKLRIHGSDGRDYAYLLKGHEDLRQDERVMQLFGLVNTLLANDRRTSGRDLAIARYAVVPLSPNIGLIGWVPNCDTLHSLIKEHREQHKTPLNLEHRLLLSFAPDHDHLPVINKVEVFQYAMENTAGEDLSQVLWLKSRSSEMWLERRTQYTRSLAVMSMVGYLLGLGDRHPSNLMIDRWSGKVLHIDFGDCFEASMHREKFPERVPFRLTRMLVKAMGVCGVEGNYRYTCEDTQRVLRSNWDSVLAMLEAFVHDPLINWRLLSTNQNAQQRTTQPPRHYSMGTSQQPQQQQQQQSQLQVQQPASPQVQQVGPAASDTNEALNERAMAVMTRMRLKLSGRCGGLQGVHHSAKQDTVAENVEEQVERLIKQAQSAENLAQSYVGWCAFW